MFTLYQHLLLLGMKMLTKVSKESDIERLLVSRTLPEATENNQELQNYLILYIELFN